MDLKDKVVVITGGTRGLGKALALSFLKNNSKVIICAREDGGELEPGILFKKADVVKENDIEELAKFVVEKFGKIDVWINNAGIWMPHKVVEETDWKRAHNLIEVNLFGVVYGSKAAVVQMKKQGSGVIINIVSVGALDGRKHASAYRASKFAEDGFTKCLREEEKESNIKVISIYPAEMKTDLFDEKRSDKYEQYMDPNMVADKIVENLKQNDPVEELIIRP